MGLGETSNFSIFTSVGNLIFCTHSYSNSFYLTTRFLGLNGKVCKMMMSHFSTLSILTIPVWSYLGAPLATSGVNKK